MKCAIQPSAGRRFVLTGGTGFPGSHLCGRLLPRGDTVICVDNMRSGDPRDVAGWNPKTPLRERLVATIEFFGARPCGGRRNRLREVA